MRIKREEIVGILDGQRLICADCVSDEDFNSADANEILTLDEVEESGDVFFCDECKKRIG
jgi:hypothetical protein